MEVLNQDKIQELQTEIQILRHKVESQAKTVESLESPSSWWLWGLLGLIPVALVIYGVMAHELLGGWKKSGTFGDTFGVMNALFAGLAFVGLIYTVYLQRKELAMQRSELKEARAQFERQAAAQESYAKEMLRNSLVGARAAHISAVEGSIRPDGRGRTPFTQAKVACEALIESIEADWTARYGDDS